MGFHCREPVCSFCAYCRYCQIYDDLTKSDEHGAALEVKQRYASMNRGVKERPFLNDPETRDILKALEASKISERARTDQLKRQEAEDEYAMSLANVTDNKERCRLLIEFSARRFMECWDRQDADKKFLEKYKKKNPPPERLGPNYMTMEPKSTA